MDPNIEGRKLTNSVIVRGPERLIDVKETSTGEFTNEVIEKQVGEYPVNRVITVDQVVEKVINIPSDDTEYMERTISEESIPTPEQGLIRRIPLPVEEVTTMEFWLPRMRVEYESVEIPLYIPKFIEVPYPADLLDEKTQDYARHFNKHIDNFSNASSASLCEVENVASAVTATDFSKMIASANIPKVSEKAWLRGKLKMNLESYEKLLNNPFDSTPLLNR